VHSLTPNLKLGFGSYSYFAGVLENNLNWVGRYYIRGETMLGMSFQPSIAFRAADWLSIGGGPSVMMGFLRAKAGINTLNPRIGDGQVRYQNWTVNVVGNCSRALSAITCGTASVGTAAVCCSIVSWDGDAPERCFSSHEMTPLPGVGS
jgi:long-subunit fatty acid transport protein